MGILDSEITGIEKHLEFIKSFGDMWKEMYTFLEDKENNSKTLEELNESQMVKVMAKA